MLSATGHCCVFVYRRAEKATPMQNGTYSASEQRLLSEEEELERMMKELQETFPTAEGIQALLFTNR